MKKHVRIRGGTRWLAGILLLILIFVGVLPTLFSTSWGKAIFATLAKRNLPPGSLEIESLSLSWFYSQKAQGIRYTSTDMNPGVLLTADKIQTESPLWKIVLSRTFLKNISLENGVFQVDQGGGKVTFSAQGGSTEKDSFESTLQGIVHQGEKSGPLSATYIYNPKSSQLHARAEHIPTQTLGEIATFLGYSLPVEVIGPSLDLTIEGSGAPPSLKMDLEIATSRLTLSARTWQAQNKVALEGSVALAEITFGSIQLSNIKATFSSEDLHKAVNYQLQANTLWQDKITPIAAEGEIHKTNFSAAIDFAGMHATTALKIDYAPLNIKGTCAIDAITAYNTTLQREATLSAFTSTFHLDEKKERFSFQGSGLVQSGPDLAGAVDIHLTVDHLYDLSALSTAAKLGIIPKSGSGSFQADIKARHFLSPNATLDLTDLSSNTEITFAHFPAPLLDSLASVLGMKHPPFEALLGAEIEGSGTLSIEHATGPITLDLSSKSARISLAGKLHAAEFVLSKPLRIRTDVTPELSNYIVNTLNPLSLTSLSSTRPISLEISHEGFFFPLSPFNLSGVNIPKIHLEVGEISSQNEGTLNIAVGLLKSIQLSKEKELKVWFAPLDATLQRGILTLQRTEILLSRMFEIALWGDIDVVNDNVSMTLGLTAQALKKAFGIKDLPKNYVLHIPLKGTMNTVKIDKGTATKKIAALMIWQQKSLAGGLAGGFGGALAGKFIDKLGLLPDQKAYTPPPQRPFPWEN